ncbi:hypothetical protein ACFL5O_05645 [Myxococcota bacterium]
MTLAKRPKPAIFHQDIMLFFPPRPYCRVLAALAQSARGLTSVKLREPMADSEPQSSAPRKAPSNSVGLHPVTGRPTTDDGRTQRVPYSTITSMRLGR